MMISLTWLLISCAQHEGLVSKTSLLVFYNLVSIPHKIVLNGKTLSSLPNQRLLVDFEASCVHSSESRGCFLVTRRSVMPSCWWQSTQSCPSLLFTLFLGLFFNPVWSWSVLCFGPALAQVSEPDSTAVCLPPGTPDQDAGVLWC